MSSQTDAAGIKAQERKEQSTQEIELFLHIFLDGMQFCPIQRIKRDAYRNNEPVPNALQPHPANSLCLYEVENPNADPSQNEDIEDEKHIHKTIEINSSPKGSSRKGYINTIKRTKSLISKEVKRYCSRRDVESIRIHLFLYGFDQNCFLGSILYGLEDLGENERSKQINDLFADKKFLSDQKVRYWAVEYVASFDRLSTSSGGKEQNMSELSWTSNWWEKGKNSDKKNSDKGSPDEYDFWNAAVLCQHTYTCQRDGEKSVVDWGIGIIQKGWSMIKNLFWKKKETIESENYWDTLHNNHNCRWEDVSDDIDLLGAPKADTKGFVMKSVWSGFYSRLYRLVDEKGTAQKYMYCTAGTNVLSIADWFSNFAQGLVGFAPQYYQSVRNAKVLDKVLKNDILLFIGHSLGGGLASNNALVTLSRHAITFNAAGLNPLRIPMTVLCNNPKEFFHISEAKQRIHARIIEGEILHLSLAILGELPFGQEESSYIEIEDGKIAWPLLGHINRSLKRHGLEALINDRQEKSFMYSIMNSRG